MSRTRGGMGDCPLGVVVIYSALFYCLFFFSFEWLLSDLRPSSWKNAILLGNMELLLLCVNDASTNRRPLNVLQMLVYNL